MATHSSTSSGMNWTIDDALTVSLNREYMANPLVSYICNYTSYDDKPCLGEFEEFNEPALAAIDEYTCLYERETNPGETALYTNVSYSAKYSWTRDGASGEVSMGFICPTTVVWANYGDFEAIMRTNIPIFLADDFAYAQIYTDPTKTEEQRNIALKHAFNFSDPKTPDGMDFEIKNMWTTGIWINDTQPAVTNIYYRNFRARLISGKFALYPISGVDDNKLKFGILNDAVFEEMQKSEDGSTWAACAEFPYEYFYRMRVNELSPTPTTPIGYALTWANSKIPIFADEDTAQDYLDDLVGIDEAINWGDISPYYPIGNGTGIEDDNSDFGEVYTEGIFTQQYIMDSAALHALANDLFDTQSGGLWEDFKAGLDMYPNYMDAVMSLTFWPVDLTTIFSNVTAASYVWFGGYGWEPSGGNTYRIIYPNAEYVIGTFKVYKTFNSWRDYEPYTKLYVTLPYCGTYQLDLARYSGETIQVKYHFDTTCGTCICILSKVTDSGYVELDHFNGQAGVGMPITLTDKASYVSAQINTLLGGGGQAIQQFGNGVGSVAGASTGLALAGAGAGVAVGGALVGAKTVYGLSMNNINNFNKTRGGSTPMINEYLPQSVSFMFEIQQDIYYNESTKKSDLSVYNAMFGAPSMKPGKLYNFSGFLKCQAVKLECGIATERERERLKTLLLNGVYI